MSDISDNARARALGKALDRALKDGLLTPPKGFVERVMAELPARAGHTLDSSQDRNRAPSHAPDLSLDRPKLRASSRTWLRDVIEWLALGGAVLAGSSQLAGFLFGIFAFTSAA